MNEVAIKYSEKELLTFFQKIRLEKAKELSDCNAGRTFNKKEGASFGETISSFGRFLERNLKSSDTVKKDASLELNKFNSNNEKVMSKEEVENELDRLFENDKYGLARLVFGVSIVLDSEYSYEYLEEGLTEASRILYKDDNSLLEIKRQIEENYRAVSLTSLSSLEKGAIIGAATLTIIFAPILALASAAVGIIAAHEIYKQNNEKYKEEFKKSSSKDNSFYLALELTYIQRLRKLISGDEFKEELDSILKHIEELKSDLDYYLFVERESTKENREKMLSFNAFDKRLMKILEIE
jgi:hypothetical protein